MEKTTHPLSRIADSVGRVVLALMVLLVTLDVVLRYFFNRPIKGSYELIEFMMVLVVFLGLAYTQTKKGHVSITLFTGKLSPGQLAVILSITYLLCIIIFSLITWRGIVQAEALRVNGTSSDLLFIPNFPFMWIVVIASVLLSLVFLGDFFKSVDDVLKTCKRPWLWLGLGGLFVLVLITLPDWLRWLQWDLGRPVMGLVGIALLILLLFSSMPIGPGMAVIG